jgi:excinuclease UvrABC nuclease subunit
MEAAVARAFGPTIAGRVVATFGSAKAIRSAADDDLLAVRGIGPARLPRLRAVATDDFDGLLDGVRGLGPAKRGALREAFPTATAFLSADDAALRLPGFSEQLVALLAERRDAPEDYLA